MPDTTVPLLDRPSITVTVADLAHSHTSAVREPSGACSVTIGTVYQRVTLIDDPAVLMGLLSDGLAQLQAITRG